MLKYKNSMKFSTFRDFQQNNDISNVQKNGASNFNKKTGRFEVGSVRFRKQRANDLKTETDTYGRPVQKIAVLCGPPGKTDLLKTILLFEKSSNFHGN